MAFASLHCYPLLNPSSPRSFSARTAVLTGTGGATRPRRRRRLQRCLCSQFAERRSPPDAPPPAQLERLFSSVNRATMKHEPGSVTGSILLVAGTTVGAGILEIPAVTQEAGFLASAVTCIFCWIYMENYNPLATRIIPSEPRVQQEEAKEGVSDGREEQRGRGK